MKNKIILVLMQLRGINRKTLLKSFVLSPHMECSVEGITEVIRRARIEDNRIKEFSADEINEAVFKADKIIENSTQKDIKIVTYLDEDYPVKLKKITDPPTVLYYKGDISYLNKLHAVAIIGTREPTEYGIKIARNLGASFGKRDYVVISGLAFGCDTYGHEGCLDENGKTIAVMPCGLDTIYPKTNKELAEKILEKGGCLISEYPIGTKIYKNCFVERDRLQSGLSDGVLVVETGEKGGTLHTIGYALEYHRLLGCYNHPPQYLKEPKTFGNQKLIREGKALPIGTNDQLVAFREKMETSKKETESIKVTQKTIYDYLSE